MKKIIVPVLVLGAISVPGYLLMSSHDGRSIFSTEAISDVSSPQEPGKPGSSVQAVNKSSYQLNKNSVDDTNALASIEGPVPEGGKKKDKPERFQIWEASTDQVNVDGISGFKLSAEPNLSGYLDINQIIEFPIPNEPKKLVAKIETTHNHTPNVAVWKGKIKDGSRFDNVTIVTGKIETHITIATEEATYIAIVNNASGKGSIVNQSDINAGQVPFDDAIPVEPLDVHPPELSYQGH